MREVLWEAIAVLLFIIAGMGLLYYLRKREMV